MKNISEILKEERRKKGYSIDDVVSATKIRRSFLEDIESGNYKSLPSETYALGFVKNYAKYLGIPEARAAALFRREYEDKKKIEVMPDFRKGKTMPARSIILRSPKSYLVGAVVLVVLSYIIFQFSFLFIGPKLSISSPKENQEVKDNIVVVSGKTDPYATVSVNNDSVYVDLSGSFRKTLYLYSGNQKVEIVAKNRYGKQTKKTIDVAVK